MVVDGLPPGEGAFFLCSFWFVDNLILLGELDEAVAMFERLLSLRNELGLLAEEYDPALGRLVGNYLQAFSHIGLVNGAPARRRPARARALISVTAQSSANAPTIAPYTRWSAKVATSVARP